jgi:hypothetical protein
LHVDCVTRVPLVQSTFQRYSVLPSQRLSGGQIFTEFLLYLLCRGAFQFIEYLKKQA